jgi:hypothetical protein
VAPGDKGHRVLMEFQMFSSFFVKEQLMELLNGITLNNSFMVKEQLQYKATELYHRLNYFTLQTLRFGIQVSPRPAPSLQHQSL